MSWGTLTWAKARSSWTWNWV